MEIKLKSSALTKHEGTLQPRNNVNVSNGQTLLFPSQHSRQLHIEMDNENASSFTVFMLLLHVNSQSTLKHLPILYRRCWLSAMSHSSGKIGRVRNALRAIILLLTIRIHFVLSEMNSGGKEEVLLQQRNALR